MNCPVCLSEPNIGKQFVDQFEYAIIEYDCPYCEGTSRVSLWKWLSYVWRCGLPDNPYGRSFIWEEK
jgi:hypothetical protein